MRRAERIRHLIREDERLQETEPRVRAHQSVLNFRSQVMSLRVLYERGLNHKSRGFGHAGFPVHPQTNSTNNVISKKRAASLCVQETVFVLRHAVRPHKRSSNDNETEAEWRGKRPIFNCTVLLRTLFIILNNLKR